MVLSRDIPRWHSYPYATTTISVDNVGYGGLEVNARCNSHNSPEIAEHQVLRGLRERPQPVATWTGAVLISTTAEHIAVVGRMAKLTATVCVLVRRDRARTAVPGITDSRCPESILGQGNPRCPSIWGLAPLAATEPFYFEELVSGCRASFLLNARCHKN